MEWLKEQLSPIIETFQSILQTPKIIMPLQAAQEVAAEFDLPAEKVNAAVQEFLREMGKYLNTSLALCFWR
jgi:hypothetical protein